MRLLPEPCTSRGTKRRRKKVEEEECDDEDLFSPELAAGGFAFTTQVPMNIFDRFMTPKKPEETNDLITDDKDSVVKAVECKRRPIYWSEPPLPPRDEKPLPRKRRRLLNGFCDLS